MRNDQKTFDALPFKSIGDEIIQVTEEISFRSFSDADLQMLHGWVNQEYARQFWQMRGSIGLLRSCYQCIMQNPYVHSFIGLYKGEAICQFDLYKVAIDELSSLVTHEPNDCGFHLIMSPNKNPVHGLTDTLIKAFLSFYFRMPQTGTMFAEPDATNTKSIQLLETAGFSSIATVQMSYKAAHVYSLTKQQFYAKNPIA